ncbi:HNH endonuclease (plasmid) [Glaciihabitans sp. INWT7]|uniref:HNH endonuclease n=1 Tax=Glaciihabitans sp. INWT7 TaxID=2596912 RepID=UPI0016242F92|nr:HNH endonuclease signature motif containing protein [Glaciihabitans sp. INWT7]QNE48716.1 HNH endonuclease [Glaciihabitans sp. INWT7]
MALELTAAMMAELVTEMADDPAPRSGTEAYEWVKFLLHGAGQTTCPICLTEIDLARKFPHPASVELDHILPSARGGRHTVGNLQLAHKYCNGSKCDERAIGYPSVEQAAFFLGRRTREVDEPGWMAPALGPADPASGPTIAQLRAAFKRDFPDFQPS